MKSALVCLSVVLAAGCGHHEDGGHHAAPAAAKAQAPAAPKSDVTDEQIGLPAYPGATEVEYSRVKLHNEMGDSYSIYYLTADTPTQVAAFYRAEGAKLGTVKEPMAVGDLLKSISVDRADGTQSAIQARTDGKGKTLVSLHRFFPVKKPA